MFITELFYQIFQVHFIKYTFAVLADKLRKRNNSLSNFPRSWKQKF